MALITANGKDVDEIHVSMPLQGAWVADLSIDAESGFAPGESVTIAAAGGLELKGTVLPSRGGEHIGSVQTRVVGGNGGLSKLATPTNYQSAKVSDIVGALMDDAGEKLSSTIDTALLSRVVDRWHVVRQPVATALAALLAAIAPSASWRVLSDGTVWFGEETWPTLSVDAEVMTRDPAENTAELGVDTLSITPGVTLPDLGRVELVEHWVGSDKARSVVTFEASGAERGKGALLALARAAFPTIRYQRLYRAKVVKQNGQKVDVDCDDPDIGSLVDVPIRHGLPGIEVTIAPQAWVRLGFDDGDPQKPFVGLWDGGESVTEIKIAGSTYSIPKWDDFLSGTGALKDALDVIKTALTTNCVNGAPLLAPLSPELAKLTAFIAALGGPTYKLSKIKYG
jgi:hypothetical protein